MGTYSGLGGQAFLLSLSAAPIMGDTDRRYVDDDELSLLLANWNAGTPPAGGDAVPEPATLLMLTAGSLALIRRRT